MPSKPGSRLDAEIAASLDRSTRSSARPATPLHRARTPSRRESAPPRRSRFRARIERDSDGAESAATIASSAITTMSSTSVKPPGATRVGSLLGIPIRRCRHRCRPGHPAPSTAGRSPSDCSCRDRCRRRHCPTDRAGCLCSDTGLSSSARCSAARRARSAPRCPADRSRCRLRRQSSASSKLEICDLRGGLLGLLAAAGEFRNHDRREHRENDEHEQHFDEGESARRRRDWGVGSWHCSGFI